MTDYTVFGHRRQQRRDRVGPVTESAPHCGMFTVDAGAFSGRSGGRETVEPPGGQYCEPDSFAATPDHGAFGPKLGKRLSDHAPSRVAGIAGALRAWPPLPSQFATH